MLGALKGQVFAGAGGNEKAFVFAIDMAPVMIRIAGYLARSSDKTDKEEMKKMQIAFLENGQVCLESLNKRVWNDITL